MVREKDTAQLANEMREARKGVAQEDLSKVLSTTDWLVRVLGDLNGGAVGFHFGKEQNQVGLLGKVLFHFDAIGVDKTTTTAQRLPDGSVQFFIGVEPDLDDPSVMEAKKEVLEELGAKPLEDGFTL
jgi:hypothetical protein